MDQSGEANRTGARSRLINRLRLAAVLAMLGGPVIIAIGGFKYYQVQRLRTEGVSVEATLHDKQERATGRGRRAYWITLDYRPPGRAIYRQEFAVDAATFNNAVATGRALVTYLPGDPSTAAVGAAPAVETELFAIGGALLVVGVVVWFATRPRTRRAATTTG